MLSIVTMLVLAVASVWGAIWLLTNDLYADEVSSAEGGGISRHSKKASRGERARLIGGTFMAFLGLSLLLLGKVDYHLIHAVKTARWGQSYFFSQQTYTVHDEPNVKLEGVSVKIEIPEGKWAQWVVVTLVSDDEGKDSLKSFAYPGDKSEFTHSLLGQSREIRVHYGNAEGPSASAVIPGPATGVSPPVTPAAGATPAAAPEPVDAATPATAPSPPAGEAAPPVKPPAASKEE